MLFPAGLSQDKTVITVGPSWLRPALRIVRQSCCSCYSTCFTRVQVTNEHRARPASGSKEHFGLSVPSPNSSFLPVPAAGPMKYPARQASVPPRVRETRFFRAPPPVIARAVGDGGTFCHLGPPLTAKKMRKIRLFCCPAVVAVILCYEQLRSTLSCPSGSAPSATGEGVFFGRLAISRRRAKWQKVR